MDIVIGLLGIGLFIALIVGMIKPSLILGWTKKPTRLKVFGFWILSVTILTIMASFFVSEEDMAKTYIETAQQFIKTENYEGAISSLKKIDTESPLYGEAKELLTVADSLSKVTDQEKQLALEAAKKNKEEENKAQQKEQLKREISSFNKGVDLSSYRGTLDALQMEIASFGAWAMLITDGLESDDAEIKKLAGQLKTKVVKLQTKEFPILRKEYGKIISNKLWENDIEVSTNGTGNRYINITGGTFAANKNKQDFQQEVQEALRMYRFTQSRYRWYKGQDEYTYYDMKPDKDSQLVTFNN